MFTATRRAAATLVAAGAVAAVASVSFGAPANAATILVSDAGEATVLLDAAEIDALDADSNWVTALSTCDDIVDEVQDQLQIGVYSDFTSDVCLQIARECISKFPANTQLYVGPDNAYTCSSYSTGESLFIKVGGLLFP